MAYYTCPKCQSTYELRAGLTHCPACLAPIKGREDELLKEYEFDKNEIQTLEDDNNQHQVEEPVKVPAYKDMSFSPVNESASSIDEGSYLVGFVLAFFLSWIGLIIAAVMQKKKTLRGALITFLVIIALDIIAMIILFSTGFFKQFEEAFTQAVES